MPAAEPAATSVLRDTGRLPVQDSKRPYSQASPAASSRFG